MKHPLPRPPPFPARARRVGAPRAGRRQLAGVAHDGPRGWHAHPVHLRGGAVQQVRRRSGCRQRQEVALSVAVSCLRAPCAAGRCVAHWAGKVVGCCGSFFFYFPKCLSTRSRGLPRQPRSVPSGLPGRGNDHAPTQTTQPPPSAPSATKATPASTMGMFISRILGKFKKDARIVVRCPDLPPRAATTAAALGRGGRVLAPPPRPCTRVRGRRCSFVTSASALCSSSHMCAHDQAACVCGLPRVALCAY